MNRLITALMLTAALGACDSPTDPQQPYTLPGTYQVSEGGPDHLRSGLLTLEPDGTYWDRRIYRAHSGGREYRSLAGEYHILEDRVYFTPHQEGLSDPFSCLWGPEVLLCERSGGLWRYLRTAESP